MRALRPAQTVLLVAAALLAGLAQVAGVPLDTAGLFAAAGVSTQPLELVLLLDQPRLTRERSAKQRAEAHLIDFVELMWPVLDPGQPFVRTWVQEAICQHLEAVSDGRISKLAINVPPGFTKSRIVNVA